MRDDIETLCEVIEQLNLENTRLKAEVERLRAALQEFACSCSSLGECESIWDLDGECRYLTARRALEGKL